MKKHIILAILIVAGHTVPASISKADETDSQTMQLLEAIMAGYEANRNKITSLAMSGKILFQTKAGEELIKKETSYRYYQLQENKRIDRGYFGREPDNISVFNGKNMLFCLQESKPNRVDALIKDAHYFNSVNDLLQLDCIARSQGWNSHVEHLEFLLKRWDPQKDSVKTGTVYDDDGNALLKVTYETTRGGPGKCVWEFDPLRGYEVTRATFYSADTENRNKLEIDASYKVEEVAAGIWRPTGIKLSSERHKADNNYHGEISIDCDEISVNDGSVDEQLFTFQGMGIKDGVFVADETFDPPLIYQYGVANLIDLHSDLEETHKETKKLASITPKENQSVKECPNSLDSEIKNEHLTAELSTPLDNSRFIIVWLIGVIIFLASTFMGVKYFKRHE